MTEFVCELSGKGERWSLGVGQTSKSPSVCLAMRCDRESSAIYGNHFLSYGLSKRAKQLKDRQIEMNGVRKAR